MEWLSNHVRGFALKTHFYSLLLEGLDFFTQIQTFFHFHYFVLNNLNKEGLGVIVAINFDSKVSTLLCVIVYAMLIKMTNVEAQHCSMSIQRAVSFLGVRIKTGNNIGKLMIYIFKTLPWQILHAKMAEVTLWMKL